MISNNVRFGKIIVQGGNDFGFSTEAAQAVEKEMGAHYGWKATATYWEAHGFDVFVVANSTQGPHVLDYLDTRFRVSVSTRKSGDKSYGQELLSQEIPASDPGMLSRSTIGIPVLSPGNVKRFVADLHRISLSMTDRSWILSG